MTIPARNIWCVEAGHRSRLYDDVLEDFVQTVSNMNLAIGIGGAIMKHESWGPGSSFADSLIQSHFAPACDGSRLRFLEIGFHREAGLGEVKRLLPFSHRRFHCSSWS